MNTLSRFLMVLLLFPILYPSLVGAIIPKVERDALIDLYDATRGDNWRINTNWLDAPGTECTWYGITCNYEETAVLEIDLKSNNLFVLILP